MIGNPLITYDPNGNIIDGNLHQAYDVENHVTTETIDVGPTSHPTWYYDTSGKRVVEIETLANGNKPWTLYLYDIAGHLSATLTGNSYNINVPTRNAYFGNRLIQSNGAWVVTDRLGSVRANSNGETFAYLPYGEERTPTANARIKFGTYTRDSTIYNQDYADQRYYNPWYGRFNTPDPSGMSAVNPKNPKSWNMYAYVNGDPVNKNDPTGLDDEGLPGGCSLNGMWVPGCDIAIFTGIQRFVPVTAFTRAVSNLNAAVEAFEDRSNFSQNCQNDIAAIAAAAPSYIDPASITIDALQRAASGTVFANGVGSTVSQAALYPNAPQAASNVANQPIGALFADRTKLTTAVTALGGNAIYINPSAISGSLVANEGLLMHELLHELGLSDDVVGTGLQSIDPSIRPDVHGDWTNTKQFSTKLGKDCFTGADNRN